MKLQSDHRFVRLPVIGVPVLEPLDLIEGADFLQQLNDGAAAVTQNILRDQSTGSAFPHNLHNVLSELT